jgi:hypothetical protein
MEAFIILLIFAGTIALIASPFFKGVTEVWETAAMDTKLNKLNAAKDSYYKAIKDVDFEYAEGKLSEKDYNELRGYYKERAILTVKEIEKLKASIPHPKAPEKEGKQKKGKR